MFSSCSLPVLCLFFAAALLTVLTWSCLNLWVHCDSVTSRSIECSNQKVKGFPSVKGLMGNDCKWPDDGLSAESAVHFLLDEGGVFNAVFSWVYTGHWWTLVLASCRNMWLFYVITMCRVVISVASDLSSPLNEISYFSDLMPSFCAVSQTKQKQL